MPLLLVCGNGAVLAPMMRRKSGALHSLTTPYSLSWRPLAASGMNAAQWHVAGRDFGRQFRGKQPVVLEALPDAPELDAFLDGVREAGLRPLRYAHFGNWHGTVQAGGRWAGYLEARPSVLRNTIRRKVARCAKEFQFSLLDAPGPALESGVGAYEAVRALSWKSAEPFPRFDGALMRGLASAGTLRLGVLRRGREGHCVAAQYWAVSPGRATVLKLAHDETYRAASPGTALTAMMLERILNEDTVREVDFGRGDDAYKGLWASQRRQRSGAVLVDPRYPAGLSAIARHAAGGLFRAIRKRGAGA